MSNASDIGKIGWIDITVDAADDLRDFYKEVTGWTTDPVQMDGYEDYCMIAAGTGEAVAGVCHARGSNADLPRQWLIYINVEDAEASAKRCEALGGKVLVGPRPLAGGTFAVIEDPSGAVAAVYQAP